MAIKLGAGGGGGGSPFPVMVFQNSQTWACPVAMEALVYVIGGGGSGALNGSGQSVIGTSGGTAGGCAVSKLTLAAQNYTLTVGAGGEPLANVESNGNAGGSSSMSGTGMTTMTANGGAGGVRSTATSQAAISGGTATGGNLMNNTGGGVEASPTANERAAGGGAVGLWKDGNDAEWETEAYAVVRGARVSGPSQFLSSSTGYLDNDIYRQNDAGLPLSINPFSSIQYSYQISNYEDQLTINTDNASNFSYVSTRYYIHPQGPFSGGSSYRRAAGTSAILASAGIAGSGGGSCNNNVSNSLNRSGGGGSGLIIICPLSMGA